MDINNYLSKYMKAEELTHEIVTAVERVEEVVLERDGEREPRLVLHGTGLPKPVLLGKTQLRQIASILNSTKTEVWIGRRLMVYREPDVWYGGKQVGGVRFRAAPAGGAPASEQSPF